MKRPVLAALCCLLLGACATPSSKISAAYVSPVLYQNLSCEQLALEAQSVSSRVAFATGAQDKQATTDAVAFTVGMVVFWPALFLMDGDGPKAAELARLKGEMDAIQTASNHNTCGIQFQAPAPAPKPVSAPVATR